MADFYATVAALKPRIASQFCCDCASGAASRIAKYRWPRQEHLRQLDELKQQLTDAFERPLVHKSLWLACMYVAAGAQTVAIWSSYGAGNVNAKMAHLRLSEKAWVIGGIAWTKAWESEQQWQIEHLAEFLRKEKK